MEKKQDGSSPPSQQQRTLPDMPKHCITHITLTSITFLLLLRMLVQYEPFLIWLNVCPPPSLLCPLSYLTWKLIGGWVVEDNVTSLVGKWKMVLLSMIASSWWVSTSASILSSGDPSCRAGGAEQKPVLRPTFVVVFLGGACLFCMLFWH